ncbi:MAG: hypothetical protein NC131_13405 [Roseburia sp.]|nr:hypothetical protein [Roseburia sp.]
MTRKEFTDAVSSLVSEYIFEGAMPELDPQLRVVPATLEIAIVSAEEFQNEIADGDETIETAAAAQGPRAENDSDTEVNRIPDFYPVRILIKPDDKGGYEVDTEVVAEVADNYF